MSQEDYIQCSDLGSLDGTQLLGLPEHDVGLPSTKPLRLVTRNLNYRVIILNQSVYEPKHVVRNTSNTSNKLRVVYDYIIL